MTADVDPLFDDVRRLVEAAKNIDSGNLVDDVFYRALDSIYQRGWHDQFHNRPYDARGNKEWQFAFNLMHKIKQAIAAVERHLATSPPHNSPPPADTGKA